LGIVGKLLGKNLLPIGSLVLLGAEINAPADEGIGVEVHRLAIYDATDKLIRRQAFHRCQAMRRIRRFQLKTGRARLSLDFSAPSYGFRPGPCPPRD
jgi:hypothetical protein